MYDNPVEMLMSENPKFVVFCGPMFSGKSSRLLAALDRYRYQHKRIVVFKPLMDDRYSVGEVVTHSGLKTPAVSVGASLRSVSSSARMRGLASVGAGADIVVGV
ncbi:hypothetical protein EBZ80_17260 [bacterium]|nr:hypothetical protein [bacterium]